MLPVWTYFDASETDDKIGIFIVRQAAVMRELVK